MKKIFYILLFILSFLFYWNTGQNIENRTESEDAYEYALMVEQGSGHEWFFHQHHLIYGPSMRLIYDATRLVGYNGRAIYVMRLVSALAASGTLFFFFLFCYHRFSLRPISSFLATAFLGFSYGFWRYSAESEIPLVASFFMVAAFYYASDSRPRYRSFILGVLFSILSILLHIMNSVAVFVAIPCYYLSRKRWKAAGLQLLISGGVVAGVYSLVARAGIIYVKGDAHFISMSFGSVIKAMVAFVQCIVSCDFMLGFASVRAFLNELFAGRMLLEEFYMGEQLSRFHVLLSALTFTIFAVLALACVLRAGWMWKNIVVDRKRFQLPEGLSALIVAGIFFLGYAGMLLLIEPGNPELWVMGLMPFGLLLCGLVLLPLTFDNRLWLPFLMVTTLFIHNLGAIRVLYDSDKDYQQKKAVTILEIAGCDDVIITAGNPVFERYLRYHFAGQIWYLHRLNPEKLGSNEILLAKGNVYVLGDVFEQPRSLRVRFPEKTTQIDRFSESIHPLSEFVAEDDFGGVYRLKSISK